VPPAEELRAAPGIGERPGEAIGQPGIVQAERRPTLRVKLRLRPDRRTRQHRLRVGTQRLDLGGINDAFENIVAVPPISRLDVGMQRPVRGQPQGAAIADLGRQPFPSGAVGAHPGVMLGAGEGCRGRHGLGQVVHGTSSLPWLRPSSPRRPGLDKPQSAIAFNQA
jgi:hypothetical protein